MHQSHSTGSSSGHVIGISRGRSRIKLGEVSLGRSHCHMQAKSFRSLMMDLIVGREQRRHSHFQKHSIHHILSVMGDNEWRDEREWPLTRTQWTPFYLHSRGSANSRFGDGTLSINKPENEPTDTYQYDPAHPVPFITDPTSTQIGGPDDYSAIERRDNVLGIYDRTSGSRIGVRDSSYWICIPFPLPQIFLILWQSSVTTSLHVELCPALVWCERVFREGMDRPSLIEPGKIYKFSIDCWNTCQIFKTGHRIGLEISSSAFPKFDRNLNTGAPLGLQLRWR